MVPKKMGEPLSTDSPAVQSRENPVARLFRTAKANVVFTYSCIQMETRGSMKTLNSKVIFIVLQLGDLLSTLACFHFGLIEKNPVNIHLIAALGVLPGLLVAKLATCVVVLPMKRLVWLGNVFYSGVVVWNLFLASVFGLATLARA
jgi:hypothetical protein